MPDKTKAGMKCVIVGAAPLFGEQSLIIELIKAGNVYTVATDGGIDFFIRNNIVPDEWIGDMDSAVIPESFDIDGYLDKTNVIRVSPIKDETDMELGLIRAFEKGCTEAEIFGATGGKRPDHTIANIQLICGYARRGRKVRIISDRYCMFVLSSDEISFDESMKGYISVFSLSDTAAGVSLKGFKYEYEGDMHNEGTLGVSNEFEGRPAHISVMDGDLLIVHERN